MRAFALSCALLAAPCAAVAQAPPDATVNDAVQHQVVFENEHVRVIEVLVEPGARSGMHSHPPLVFIGADRGRVQMTGPDGGTMMFDILRGHVHWQDAVQHSWEFIAGRGHVFAVEVKSAAGGAGPRATPSPDTDAVVRDPTHHAVALENEHVRVFRAIASPGAESPMHTHPPMVLISLGRARFAIQRPQDREPVVFDMRPGQVLWIPGAQHQWRLLAGELEVVAVEIKSARAAP